MVADSFLEAFAFFYAIAKRLIIRILKSRGSALITFFQNLPPYRCPVEGGEGNEISLLLAPRANDIRLVICYPEGSADKLRPT